MIHKVLKFELYFNLKLGRKTIDKQQVYINVCGSLSKIQRENFSNNLTEKDKDKIISGKDKNIYFAEKIINQMSGNLHIGKSENSVNCDLNFWVPIVGD